MLDGVVLLAEQLRCAACGAGALVPGAGFGFPPVLVQAQRDEEAAQQERSLGLAEGSVVVAEAVGIAVTGELGQICLERRNGARVIGRDRAAQSRQQERGVERW